MSSHSESEHLAKEILAIVHQFDGSAEEKSTVQTVVAELKEILRKRVR